jgi:L-alanine-DL-glutamate epimerase-like enolase superfamily enzyme
LISITAALHAAYSCINTKYLDLDGSLDVMEKTFMGGFILKDGLMFPNDLPGLGVSKL